MIATLSELKSYIWITDTSQDTLLTMLLDSANDFVESYISRIVSVADYTDFFDGDGQREILLDNYPINTITSISYNIGTLDVPVWEIIPASSYKFSPKVGKIFFTFHKTRGFQNYKIIYNAGYTVIPGDLKLATLKIASWYYNKKTSDGVKVEVVAGDRLEFETSEISSDVLVILNNYRNV